MPREKPKYPTVPILPGEIETLILMCEQRYVRVFVYTSPVPTGRAYGGIAACVKGVGPKNLLRPDQPHVKAIWGTNNYSSYEGALYAALWQFLDETHVHGLDDDFVDA